MKSNMFAAFKSKAMLAVQVAGLSCALAILVHATPQSNPPAAQAQMSFATPQLAAEAIIKAAADFDVPVLLSILGPDGKDLLSSADRCSG